MTAYLVTALVLNFMSFCGGLIWLVTAKVPVRTPTLIAWQCVFDVGALIWTACLLLKG